MTLKLEVNKVYIDGHGNRIKILYTEGNTVHAGVRQPIIGIFLDGNTSPKTYEINGQYTESKSKLDIVKEYKEPAYSFFNMYLSENGKYAHDEWRINHLNKEQAILSISTTLGSGYLGTYRIDLDTGEILKVN